MSYKLLLIDDDEAMLASMKSILERNGFQADTAKSGKEGIEKVNISPRQYGVIVLDYHMQGLDGIETAEAILKITQDLFILIHSGDTEQDAATLPIRAGAAFFIQKAKGADYFLENVRFFCKQYERRFLPVSKRTGPSENEKVIAAIGMAGRSNELADIAKKILEGRIDDKATVLIRGENGTGKQLIAEAIHRNSSRHHGEFVDINCGALPSNLVESELFGHERGSFTGADKKKPGLFLKANRGTLFLDEIGDTDLSIQVKLLKAIQTKMIRPVGSNDDIRVDTRIIAATNVNLEEAILQKRFRTDLYYRLNVISLYLPPLRERPKDIEPIVLRTCELFNKERGLNKSFTPGAIEILERMAWPGNARELENVVAKILTQSFLDTITPKELKNQLTDESDGATSLRKSLPQEIEELTRRRILEAIEMTSSLREAAKLLDLPFTTFRDHLKRLGLIDSRRAM
jgi:DNA-binding NtrC family response regulator